MKNKDLLLVIDFQNVYLPEHDWACPGMRDAMKNTARLIESGKIGRVIFTQYMPFAEPQGRWKEYNREYREINENPLLSEIAPQMKPYLDGAELYVKSTYSSLTVDAIRRAAAEADHVLLTGVVAECCVLATMMEAIDLGAYAVYLPDCVAGQSRENEDAVRRVAEAFAPMHTLVMDSGTYLSADP